MGDKARGWSSKNVERYLVLLLNVLGAGKGGAVSLADKSKKPVWFSNKVNWKKFHSPSHSTMVENVDLIKGIFAHFNLDMRTHCRFPPPPAEDNEEEQPEEIRAVGDLQQQQDHEVPLVPADRALLQPGMEEEEVNPLPDQFLFEASARVTVADIHATAEDLEVAGVGGEEEEEACAEEEEGASSEPDLPDPERCERPPAVVQVIVQRKKQKNREISTRPASKQTRKAPARLLD